MHWRQKLWVKLELFCSDRNLLKWHGPRALIMYAVATLLALDFNQAHLYSLSIPCSLILFIVIVEHYTIWWMIDNWKRCNIWFLSLASRFGDYMINPAMCRWNTPLSAFSVLFILYNPLIWTLPEGRCPQSAFCKMLIILVTFPLYSMLNSRTAGSPHPNHNTCHTGVREKMSVQIA